MPIWSRPQHSPGGSDAQVALIAYTTGPLAGLSVSRSRHGVPEDAHRFPMRLDHHSREDAPQRFEELDDAEIMARARMDQPVLDLDALRRARHQVRLELTMQDPDDLEYLRACWAFMRAVCDAVPVMGLLDVHASRWWTPDALRGIPTGASFDVGREVLYAFETRADPTFGHVAYTRGMRKFGRPDVILTHRRSSQREHAGRVLAAVARAMALGARPKAGHAIALPGLSGVVESWVPDGNAPELPIRNAGLVFIDE